MLIRPIYPPDAKTVIEVHHAAVRKTASKNYPTDILEQWAPLPVTDETVTKFIENADGEVRFLAEQDGKIVGMAAIVPSKCELRACYVAPEAGGRGIGTALLHELEKEADRRGLPFLQMDSSLTAEAFYKARGYEVQGRGEHELRSGKRMACVQMRKQLTPAS